MKETIINHIYQCKENSEKLIDGIDFIICKICNFHAQNLGIHLKIIHNISSEYYITQYGGTTVSFNSNKKYSDNHFSYLTNAKKNDIDLTEYWGKVGKGISDAILSNNNERQRRTDMMIALNKIQQNDPSFKELVSKTATKTSARPEIQQQRSIQLKKWRDENPEDFYEKCVKAMITTFQSKPEKKLFEFVSSLDGFNFKKNQIIKSIIFTSSSHKRQMDIADKNKRIYIEFDGKVHFEPIFGNDVLIRNIIKDKEIERHISNHNWTLIRISYDQFIYTTKTTNKIKNDASYFMQKCLDQLVELLNNNEPGIYKIGEAYGKY